MATRAPGGHKAPDPVHSAQPGQVHSDGLPAAVVVTHSDGTVRYWNPAAERLFGWPAGEVLGRPYPLLPPGEFARLLATPAPPATAWRRPRDGPPLELGYAASRSADEITEVFTGPLDPSAHVQAEILDVVSQGAIAVDLDGHITYANKPAAALSGEPVEHLVGRNLLDLTPPGEHRQEVADMAAVVRAGSPWHGELTGLKRDGTTFPGLVAAAPVRDGAGHVTGLIAVCTDLTERKQLETRMLRSHRLESLGTLTGGIAHDLNNVLTPIQIAADLLPGTPEGPERDALLDSIRQSTDRGAALVRQILAFTRGREDERRRVDLAALVTDTERLLAPTLPKSIALTSDVSPGLPAVRGDATQLGQVLVNLCVNARDAMPEGGRITVRAEAVTLDERSCRGHSEARPGPYVVLTVADTGTGMTPDVREHLFDPFFTTKEVGKGTGLGLFTTQGIVRRHGGFVEVDSRPGHGSQFGVWLPALEPAAARPASPSALLSAAGRGEVVLVVDDERPIREAARAVLQGAGYRVLVASGGQEALDAHEGSKETVRLAIVDMLMPGMDGPATVRALRARDPQLLVVGVSGLTDPEGVAPDLGLSAFLLKPYTARRLLQVVREALEAV